MGVILKQKTYEDLSRNYSEKMNFKFAIPDIIDIRPTVKYLNYIDLASGIYFLKMSDQNKDIDSRITMDYLQKARDRLVTYSSTWCNEAHPILPPYISS